MPSSKELRRAEAQHIRALDPGRVGRELRETTWATRNSPWLVILMLFIAVGTWLGVARLLAAVSVGAQGWLPLGIGACLAVLWTMGAVAAWRRFLNVPRLHLDSSGLTYHESGDPDEGGAWAHRWSECGPFEVVTKTGDGTQHRYVQCAVSGDGTLLLLADFGAPEDVTTILNAYRCAYGSAESH